MNLRISIIVLLMSVFSFGSTNSYAAFPASSQNAEIKAKEQQVLKQNLKQEVKQAMAQFKKTEPKVTRGGASDAFGIVALIAGIAAAVLMFVPTIGVLFIPLAVCALVFGILGLKGSNKGMAIAGLILGAVEILLLILAVVFIASLLAAL